MEIKINDRKIYGVLEGGLSIEIRRSIGNGHDVNIVHASLVVDEETINEIRSEMKINNYETVTIQYE